MRGLHAYQDPQPGAAGTEEGSASWRARPFQGKPPEPATAAADSTQANEERRQQRAALREQLTARQLEREWIEVELRDSKTPTLSVMGPQGNETMGIDAQALQEMWGRAPQVKMKLRKLPLASEIIRHARQDLVRRLDAYKVEKPELMEAVVAFIETKMMPIIVRHAISGRADINTEDKLFHDPEALAILSVEGDSMLPTLAHGDQILIDTHDQSAARDGIYVLRVDDALLVKRLSLNPASRRLTIHSDNDAYPSWPDCDPSAIHIIGRVVWVGRKLT
jgi:SOS-response transcriptional repressor LexA